MTHITLKELHTEGKLSLGDTLTHSELGDYELVWVFSDGTLRLKNVIGEYIEVQLDLPPSCHIVQTKES